MNRRTLLHGLIAAAISSAALSSAAWAQAFPNRPIKLIVPFPAGGPADLFARHLANGISAELGQQVVIENRSRHRRHGRGRRRRQECARRLHDRHQRRGRARHHPVHDQQDAVRLAEGPCPAHAGGARTRSADRAPVGSASTRCRSSSPMPAPIRARSASARPAPARSRIWRPSCSRSKPRSISCMFPTGALRRP